jgi:glycosyltransferase involved in cell wall biosynthesis
MNSLDKTELKTIVVDLTPVLPGGENGGAKIFVLQLLEELAEKATATQFILLTQFASHEELAFLDKPNMHRRMVIGEQSMPADKLFFKALATKIISHLPGRLSRVVARFGYRLLNTIKRKRTQNLLNELRADLLFCPFTAPTYYEAGIPTVCTIYDLQYKSYPEFFSVVDIANRDQTFKEACLRATKLVAISDYSRDSAIEHGRLDAERISTIYLQMAQRISQDNKSSTTIISRFDLIPSQYLMYPANFWKHKNHQMLLTAFGIACHSGLSPEIKLLCTGAPGPRQVLLKHAAQVMGLGDRVVFPGYVSNVEMSALMNNSAAVVFPSLYEGFGLPVIEAMAAGVPVACSATTSIPEVAAGAAVMFDPRIPSQIAQAMVTLVSDLDLRRKCIEAGYKRAAEFSDSNRMTNEYWSIFKRAVTTVLTHPQLTGYYPDRWVGNELQLNVGTATNLSKLNLEIKIPNWLPSEVCVVQLSRTGQDPSSYLSRYIKKGLQEKVSFPLVSDAAQYKISFTPTISPKALALNADSRELSAILLSCSLIAENGHEIELFSKDVSI